MVHSPLSFFFQAIWKVATKADFLCARRTDEMLYQRTDTNILVSVCVCVYGAMAQVDNHVFFVQQYFFLIVNNMQLILQPQTVKRTEEKKSVRVSVRDVVFWNGKKVK